MIRRILTKHYRPDPGAFGPSWLTTLGHTKDSLWSVDLFRCESLVLKRHWVLVVMDQFTRRIIGFGVQAGTVDGPSLCRMFNHAIRGAGAPKYASTDNDPLFSFHRWKANLRILDVTEVKSIPHLPVSHPFVERLIGTIRREFLDLVPFFVKRRHTERANRENSHKSSGCAFLPLAQSLPRSVSPACRSLSTNSPQTAFSATDFWTFAIGNIVTVIY